MTSNSRIFPLAGRRVWVTGHLGLVGSSLVRRLAQENCQLLTVDRSTLDLRRQHDLEAWIAKHRPEVIFHAAGHVGGIVANDSAPAEFLYDNLAIALNLIEAARVARVEKLLFLGSSCIYPKLASQPIAETALLSGVLEPTNQWYAIAKIAGVKMIEACRRQYGCDFIAAMPTNLYGPYDNFDLVSSHVLPALIRKAHEAKEKNAADFTIWGTGTARREFLHVDDCADALIFLMQNYSDAAPINVGFGEDIAILDLARLVAEIVGFQGRIGTDSSKPDGTPRKLLDSRRLTDLGWNPNISLKEGITASYRWFLEHGDKTGNT